MYLKNKEGKVDFIEDVQDEEKTTECVDRIFEQYGLDISELDKRLVRLEEDDGNLTIFYQLETDLISLLEFLITKEGKESGLSLE